MILHEDNFFLEAASCEDETLSEAGGLVSWLKRAYTGMDGSLIDELRDDIKHKIHTKEDQQQTLKDIDKFIAEGEKLQTSQAVFHVLAPHGLIGPVASFIIRNSNTKDGSRQKYVAALKKVRAEVAALKLKD